MAQHLISLEGESEDFQLVFSGKIEDFTPVSKYKSKRTGLTVYIAEVDYPTVNGYICLATEAHDDDGLPHTLEHMVFLGSEEYPYKGVLDLVANRCFASGTNAFTAVDHTCYTVMTAGSEGFLNFLPAYLDHVLYPTLSDSAYITEVHHVNGEGEDAGVVYSEILGIENTGENLVTTAAGNAVYPGHCGYKSQQGGSLKNLRESTNNEKVRNFHKKFYRPENLAIIVTGKVSAEDIFRTLKPFENKIISKGPLGDFIKPWQTPVPPLLKSTDITIQYPSDDVSTGLVLIAWRGPKFNERRNIVAVQMLLNYLTSNAISPIHRDLIEIDDPFCSEVGGGVSEYSEGRIDILCLNVLFGKLHSVKSKVFEVLNKIANEEEPIDMKQMQNEINRIILSILSGLESQSHKFVSTLLIEDFLYSTSSVTSEGIFNSVSILKEMLKSDKNFWLNLLKKYLIDGHVICVVGEPSSHTMQTLAEKEANRILKQKKSLGSDGLKMKAKTLEKAIAHNEVPPPNKMIAAFKVPDINKIHYLTIGRYSNYSALAPDKNSLFPLGEIPYKFQLDDIHTNFIMLHALIDTSSVPAELRLFLPLLLEVMLESPILRNGVLIPHDVVVKELAEDTINAVTSIGISLSQTRFKCSTYAQMAHMCLEVEIGKYARGIQLLHELLFCTQLTQERIKIIATKIINDAGGNKRDGNFIASSVITELSFANESNHHANNLMRQYAFLSLLLDKLDANPKMVIDLMEKLRSALLQAKNFTFHMATDVKQLVSRCGNPVEPWNRYFSIPGSESKENKKFHVQYSHELVLPYTERLTLGAVVGVGSIDSSYLHLYAPCISSRAHPDLPALMVFLQYMNQLEGPMWKQIRGLGLAYSFGVVAKTSIATIFLMLYRCTQVVEAYKKSISVLENYLNGQLQWDASLLESARSSLMFELISSLETAKSLSITSLTLHLDKLDSNYNKTLIKRVSEVTVEDLKRVGALYIPALFDVKKSCLSITCNPSKIEEIKADFKELSRNLTVTSLDSSFMDKFDSEVFPPV